MKPLPANKPSEYNEEAPDAATPRASVFSIAPENANHEVINVTNCKEMLSDRQLNQCLDTSVLLRELHLVLPGVLCSLSQMSNAPKDVRKLISFIKEIRPLIPGAINTLEGMTDE